MIKKNKTIIGCILICLFGFMGVYYYVNNNRENNFNISHVSGNADTKMWTDNSQNNIYDIKFQVFDGTDLKEITSKKSTYNMNIDSNVDNGELNIKIYNDDKVLFEENDTTTKIIPISNDDNKNVRIEITGKKAKGHIKIRLT
jgi:hypothetical protein